MPNVKTLSWDDCLEMTTKLHERLTDAAPARVWGIPRGGSQVVAMLAAMRPTSYTVVSDPKDATLAVDDLIHSGRTARAVRDQYNLGTVTMLQDREENTWYEFPWEVGGRFADAQDTVTRIIEQIGEDPTRPGLADTPRRVVESWSELFAGYQHDNPVDVLKTFPEEQGDGQMVIIQGIDFWSTCEHHMLPFWGTSNIGYIPSKHAGVIGLSKIPRLVRVFAQRLQVQERLTHQICQTIAKRAEAVIVEITAMHVCAAARGAKGQGTKMNTLAVAGNDAGWMMEQLHRRIR